MPRYGDGIRTHQYQKGKTNLDFTEARDSEWQWHQLGHMQVCTSLQTNNHASNPPLRYLQAGCPSCRPTNSVKALKALAAGGRHNTVHGGAGKQHNATLTEWSIYRNRFYFYSETGLGFIAQQMDQLMIINVKKHAAVGCSNQIAYYQYFRRAKFK